MEYPLAAVTEKEGLPAALGTDEQDGASSSSWGAEYDEEMLEVGRRTWL